MRIFFVCFMILMIIQATCPAQDNYEIQVYASPQWEFNAGYGFGLTPSIDKSIFKVILGRRFGGKHQTHSQNAVQHQMQKWIYEE